MMKKRKNLYFEMVDMMETIKSFNLEREVYVALMCECASQINENDYADKEFFMCAVYSKMLKILLKYEVTLE